MRMQSRNVRLGFLAILILSQNARGIPSRWTPLKDAAYKGDVQRVQQLLASGVSANGELDHGLTPLHWAATQGHADVVKLLLAHGADLHMDRMDAHCPVVGTPLHCAAFMGHMGIVTELIARGADVNYQTVAGRGMVGGTALHEAARGGHTVVVEALIAAGANVNGKADRDRTVLHYAHNGGVAHVLLTKGVDANAPDADGRCPLDYAIRDNRSDVVGELAAAGVKLTLHAAAMLGDVEKMTDLIATGADVNGRDMIGRTPLYLAPTKEVALLLITKGADVNCNHTSGRTALTEAAGAGRVDVVEVLLANGADMSVQNRWGWTPMHEAVRMGHNSIVDLFLVKGFDVKTTGADLVYTGAAFGKKDIIELLVEHGAAPDVKAKNGYTPLHIAVFMGHLDVVRYLIEAGADVHTSTEHGATLLHSAVERGRKDMVELLIGAKAPLERENDAGFTPRQLAEKLGKAEISVLLKPGNREQNAGPAD